MLSDAPVTKIPFPSGRLLMISSWRSMMLRYPAPSLWSESPSAPFENKHFDGQKFRLSYESSKHEDDDFVNTELCAIVHGYDRNADESSNHKCIPDTTMTITSGRPLTADSDMQSIEVSHSDFLFNVNGDSKSDSGHGDGNGKKKRSLFAWKGLGKKHVSLTTIIPKWKYRGKSANFR